MVKLIYMRTPTSRIVTVLKLIYEVLKLLFIVLLAFPFLLCLTLIRKNICASNFRRTLQKGGIDKEAASYLARNYPSIKSILRK